MDVGTHEPDGDDEVVGAPDEVMAGDMPGPVESASPPPRPREMLRLGRWAVPVAGAAWDVSLAAHGAAAVVVGVIVLRHRPADRPPLVAFAQGDGGSGSGVYREGGPGIDAAVPGPAADVLLPDPFVADPDHADDGTWTPAPFDRVAAHVSDLSEAAGEGFIGVAPAADVLPEGALSPRSGPAGAARPGGPGGDGADEGAASEGSPGIPDGIADAHLPAPVYPRESRLRGEQGTVILELLVDATGAVTSVRVIDGSPYPRLAAAAVEAARQGKFPPALRGGRPVESRVKIPFRFRLSPAGRRR